MCWKCGNDILSETIGFREECNVCHSDLHSCKNCMFFSPGAHYDCHETVDELVKDKEAANLCDAFKVKHNFNVSSDSAKTSDKSAAAKKAFDALFS